MKLWNAYRLKTPGRHVIQGRLWRFCFSYTRTDTDTVASLTYDHDRQKRAAAA